MGGPGRWVSLVVAVLVLTAGGCVIRPTHPVEAPRPQPVVYLHQPAPVYVARPVVVHPAPRPVYYQPAPVVTPVRVAAAPYVPIRQAAPYYYRAAVCMPGSVQSCEGPTYCGHGGIQRCNLDGLSWGPCTEGY